MCFPLCVLEEGASHFLTGMWCLGWGSVPDLLDDQEWVPDLLDDWEWRCYGRRLCCTGGCLPKALQASSTHRAD